MKYFLTFLLCIYFHLGFSQNLAFLPEAKGEIIRHTYYTLSYIEEHEQPEWVAYYLSPDMLRKVYKRKDTFRPDPQVSTASATYEDYRSAPDYDAGHLLPCRQMQFDCTAMNETFYMSNMSPQHKDFNRHKWAHLEKLERNMAWRNNGLYVVTGPVLTSTLGSIGVTNQVSIPKYYYKVFLKHDETSVKAIAFLLPNEKTDTSFENFVVSIDSLEIISGIDFFPALDDPVEDVIEASTDVSQWNFSNPTTNYGYALAAQSCQSGGNHLVHLTGATRININTASISELISLPGIGPAKAKAIVRNRPYATTSDLLRVSGIGQVTLSNISDRITLEADN